MMKTKDYGNECEEERLVPNEFENLSTMTLRTRLSSFSSTKIFFTWLIVVSLVTLIEPFYSRLFSPSSSGTSSYRQQLDGMPWPPLHVVEALADESKRLVLVSVSSAIKNGNDVDALNLADNFLHSLELSGVRNFVVVCHEDRAFLCDVLSSTYPGHVLPPTKIKEGPTILRTFNLAGYGVWYVRDLGSVWNQNVFKEMDKGRILGLKESTYDALFLLNEYHASGNLFSASQMYFPNQHNSTKVFLQHWLQHTRHVVVGDFEDTLNDMFRDSTVKRHSSSTEGGDGKTYHAIYLPLHVEPPHTFAAVFGDREVFPSGVKYFGSSNTLPKTEPAYDKLHNHVTPLTKTERESVAVVRCVPSTQSGQQITDLKKFDLWNPSGRLPPAYK